ncbi:pentatricopeptide repeat protein [Colletotrichum kahawae]|uniref:Pentatricopeptide repeat protein n=1 Tax=Colletotrichum kahawae TaxID=34407 RepID=A0AAD9YDU7_COLKA|nr:pentatricopeptide repeat protein [Colletotrichum kahawae]
MLACTACLKRSTKPINTVPLFVRTPRINQHGLAMIRLSHADAITQEKFMRKLNAAPQEQELQKKTQKERRVKRVVQKELEYSEDRWKIAQQVQAMLKTDRYEEAVLLVKEASKRDDCAVAWNHVLDYELTTRKSPVNAWKLFNDMKKRGQKPNEQTYTVMFRGFANVPHPEAGVKRAVQLYRTLLQDTRVKANQIHLNAVLQACGRGKDIDSMFAIRDSADPKAGRGADARTYTTILNSLRFSIMSKSSHDVGDTREPAETQQSETLKVVDQCKRIWEEVMREWRAGKLTMDEELVLAMARILPEKELMQHLHDTMGIPNLEDANIKRDWGRVLNEDNGNSDIAAVSNKQSQNGQGRDSVNLAVPGPKTLSLLISSRATQRQPRLATDYWNLFALYYGVKPDADHFELYMSQLERRGASALAMNLLLEMPQTQFISSHVHKALQACLRDNMNPNAFTNATGIIDNMMSRAEALRNDRRVPPRIDILALILYHRVAVSADHAFRQMAKSGNQEGANCSHGKQLASAVDKLYGPFCTAKQGVLAAAKPSAKSKAKAKPPAEKVDERRIKFAKLVLDLARNLIATVDRIERRQLLEEGDQLEDLKKKRNAINRFVVELTDPQQQDSQPAVSVSI